MAGSAGSADTLCLREASSMRETSFVKRISFRSRGFMLRTCFQRFTRYASLSVHFTRNVVRPEVEFLVSGTKFQVRPLNFTNPTQTT